MGCSFLTEISEKHDVSTAVFLVDGSHSSQDACQRYGFGLRYDKSRNRKRLVQIVQLYLELANLIGSGRISSANRNITIICTRSYSCLSARNCGLYLRGCPPMNPKSRFLRWKRELAMSSLS